MSDSIGEKAKRWRELCDRYGAHYAKGMDHEDGFDYAEKMVDMLAEAADVVDTLEMKRLYYLARIAPLEEALRFYADEENHERMPAWGDNGHALIDGSSSVDHDEGERARRALAALEADE